MVWESENPECSGRCQYGRVFHQRGGTFLQQCFHLVLRHGFIKQESLIYIAAHGGEQSELLLGLHALRHHFQLETVRQRDDAAHQGVRQLCD